MIWYVIAAIAVAVLGVMLIGVYLHDRKFERERLSNVINANIMEELEEERNAAEERRDKFRAALEKAGEKGEDKNN